jgi:hypothetical protein
MRWILNRKQARQSLPSTKDRFPESNQSKSTGIRRYRMI